MWDTPFDESMLSLHNGVVINCPEESSSYELFEIFKAHGIFWSSMENTRWSSHMEDTCYFVRGDSLLFGPSRDADARSYRLYTKCTFLGDTTSDFEAASDDELMSFLGIGGG